MFRLRACKSLLSTATISSAVVYVINSIPSPFSLSLSLSINIYSDLSDSEGLGTGRFIEITPVAVNLNF